MLQADPHALVCERNIANSPTQSVTEYLMIHAIAIYVGEVVISKYNMACDNTSMQCNAMMGVWL